MTKKSKKDGTTRVIVCYTITNEKELLRREHTMTTKRQLNLAINENWYPSARWAAERAAKAIGANWLGGDLVETDECICRVKVNKRHSLYWVEEA